MNLLLFMIRLPMDVAQQVIGLVDLLKRDHGLANWTYDAQRLHITLFRFGQHVDLPPVLVERAKQAAALVEVPPFEVTFKRIEAWPDALVLLCEDGLTSLSAFRRELSVALERAGLDWTHKAAFTPHITLMRGPTTVDAQMVKTFRWTVGEFVLVNSLVGQGRYVELGRWPLRGPCRESRAFGVSSGRHLGPPGQS